MRTQRTAQMSKGFAHPENQNITIFIRINPFLFLIFCQRPQFLYFCNVIFKLLKNIQSHPVWVRGLKHMQHGPDGTLLCRTPCGCEDIVLSVPLHN